MGTLPFKAQKKWEGKVEGISIKVEGINISLAKVDENTAVTKAVKKCP